MIFLRSFPLWYLDISLLTGWSVSKRNRIYSQADDLSEEYEIAGRKPSNAKTFHFRGCRCHTKVVQGQMPRALDQQALTNKLIFSPKLLSECPGLR